MVRNEKDEDDTKRFKGDQHGWKCSQTVDLPLIPAKLSDLHEDVVKLHAD